MVIGIGTRERPQRFQSVDLGAVPHVDALLTRLGLGVLDPATVSSPRGRNDNWAGTTASGTPVFVKQFGEGRGSARMRRSRAVGSAAGERLATPRILGIDADAALMVFEYVDGGESGAELAADGGFDEALCARAGRTVADIHRLDAAGFDTDPHPLPPVSLLDALPFERFVQASAAELAMWRLLQADAPVVAALRDLRRLDAQGPAPRCPIHGDLRLDQFLVAGDRLHITDFEEARIGDPARDVGAFAGEWLFRAATDIPSRLADASPIGHVVSHDEIVATGAAIVDEQVPRIRSFFSAYLTHAPAAVGADNRLAVRAAAYAGWHLFDRMIAASENAARLSPVTRAAAGIGRTLLLAPAEFAGSLGLEA